MNGHNEWTLIIEPKKRLINLNIRELWRYRDLLLMYVKREIITFYKQTILGPLWFFIQPVFTTIVYIFVFGGIAGIPTDGIPKPLFYLSGICLWNYFQESLIKISDTFISNQAVFGKVYFPRLIVPFSTIITGLLKLFIQLILFVLAYVFYIYKGLPVALNSYALLFPVLILLLGGLGLGFGIIISSLTTKYRDLKFLITFLVQLWMYGTPVIYPLSVMKGKYENFLWLIQANPMTSILETFKFGFLGEGHFSWASLLYSCSFTVILLFLGVIIFNKVERSFMDVV